LLSQWPMRQTRHNVAARSNLYVADVDRRLQFWFHAARPPLPHTDEHYRQQAGGDDADNWQQCQGRGEVVTTLNELQVADYCTESASSYLHQTQIRSDKILSL